MTDIKFSTKKIKVKKGTTVTFVFENKGKLTHEAMLASAKEQAEHDAMMAKMTGMTMPDSPMAVSVKPGATKKISYTFAKAEKLEIGCHVPGHYAAGMKIEVEAS